MYVDRGEPGEDEVISQLGKDGRTPHCPSSFLGAGSSREQLQTLVLKRLSFSGGRPTFSPANAQSTGECSRDAFHGRSGRASWRR